MLEARRLLVFAVLCCALLAQDKLKPRRQVHGNVLISMNDPTIRIDLPKQVQYVGADRWILYDIADCEVHLFVEADAQKLVKCFHWLPGAMMNVRFVHLLDDQKRKELMIIYAEDLRPTGLTVDDLSSKSGASGRWPQLENRMIERQKPPFLYISTCDSLPCRSNKFCWRGDPRLSR